MGPVTWVPEFRTRPDDPWAHRKGEPRPLALLWSMYLMACASLTLLQVRSLTMPTSAQFVEGCRSFLLLVMLGLTLLWPMLRLSQEPPRRVTPSLLGDLLVLTLPVQAALWPMPLLTHWPISIVAAIAGASLSWTIFAAGLLAIALRGGSARARWIAMACMIGVVSAFPMIRFTAPAIISDDAWWWARLGSPATIVWALTDAPGSLKPMMRPAEWACCCLPGCIGLALWFWSGRLATPSSRG